MNNPDRSNWVALIEAIKTPMGFLVFALLLIEGTMSGFAFAMPHFAPTVAVAMFAVFVLFPLVVLLVSALWPGVLQGATGRFSSHADHFALELYAALDGALSNLGKPDREEAWAVIAEVLETAPTSDAEYVKFRVGVAGRLRRQSSLVNRTLSSKGAVPPAAG